MNIRSHLVITGPMGSGKTTVATAIAARLSIDHLDSDADLWTLFGRTGAEIAGSDGVATLHRAEAAVLIGALVRSQRVVISAAGSVVDDALALAALVRRAEVFWLDLPLEVQLGRVASGDHRRAIDPAEQLALNRRRAARCAELGWVRLDALEAPASLARIVADIAS